MKVERHCTIFSIFLNILVAIIKICGGISFNSYTLISSGYHTMYNLSEEILSSIGSIVRGRRASMKYPFGVGKVEYGSQIAFGLILIFLAIYLFIKSFFLEYAVTNYLIIFPLLFVILFLFLSANYLFSTGKSVQSQMLFSIAHSAYFDAIISLIATVFIIISCNISLFDFLGCITFSILFLYRGIKIIINNIILIKGQNDTSKKITDKVKKVISNYSILNYSTLNLINVHKFYVVTIELEINDEITIHELIKLERLIRREIKKQENMIKIIDFEIYKNN